MTVHAHKNDNTSLRGRVSAEEWQVRVDLAACYRLCHHAGITDRINTHISARVPGDADHFLLNPLGLLFDEVTASNLLKIDMDGNKVGESAHEVNRAGYVIHSAVLIARADVNCALHHHSAAGIAVSSLKEGLLPMSQHAQQFYNRIGYHDYEGIALEEEERERLGANLGQHSAMLLRNHGVLTAADSVAAAYLLMDSLEAACKAQLLAQAAGGEIHLPPHDVSEYTAKQFEQPNEWRYKIEWDAQLRMLDRLGIEYAV
jgi:ribulose-5-phosphate 4-epimerase/fuculose-1-phosphate aldolase